MAMAMPLRKDRTTTSHTVMILSQVSTAIGSEIVARHQARHQRLVAWRIDGHGHAVEEGQDDYFPYGNDLEPGKHGHCKGQQHHDGLGDKEKAALVDAIGDNSAKERKDEKRNGAGKADDAEPECGVSEGEHEPAQGYVLHPGANVGEKVSAPEEAKVGMAQCADDSRPLFVLLNSKGLRGRRCFLDGQARGLTIQLAVRVQNR